MNKLFDIKSLLSVKQYNGGGIVLSFMVLRFLACCLITNTHYNYVYPNQVFAVGGLLGDVLFFLVSGFVLARPIKERFLPWYLKRVVRIYPAIILGVIYYKLSGYAATSDYPSDWFGSFVYPSYFVFTAAIMVLYVPFFFVNKVRDQRAWLRIIGALLLLWAVVYLFVFDKSTYEMNNTYSPMILFPYFSCMLIGGYIRKFGVKKSGGIKVAFYSTLSLIFLALYFALTIIVRADEGLNHIQIVVPLTLVVGIAAMAVACYLMEDWFKMWPDKVLSVLNFVAALTLEIYVVQKPIIHAMEEIVFPLNWLLITGSILIGAVALRIVVNFIVNGLGMLFSKKEN